MTSSCREASISTTSTKMGKSLRQIHCNWLCRLILCTFQAEFNSGFGSWLMTEAGEKPAKFPQVTAPLAGFGDAGEEAKAKDIEAFRAAWFKDRLDSYCIIEFIIDYFIPVLIHISIFLLPGFKK